MTNAKLLQKIDVFISSPSDVKAERDAIYAIVTALNEEPSVRERYVLKPLAYEYFVPPEVGDKPQKVVDKYVKEAGKADLFIGVLWSRMGTPVIDDDGTEYQSGTEYEFRKAYESRTSARGKPIMLLYRSMKSIPLTADFEQTMRVQDFFKQFEGKSAKFSGLYKTYKSLSKFKTELRKDILAVLAQITPDADDIQPDKPIRRRADWYHHKRIPDNYVKRVTLLEEMRKALIDSATGQDEQGNPIALFGMGGIGKSVIARALCEDTKVQETFPDGILWATCGKAPNLKNELIDWLRALGDAVTEADPSFESLKGRVAKLLADRACLLIIDDVWDKAHAQTFRVGGANCRTILTTRDGIIAEELGAKIERIPPMSEPDAINLLELWAQGELASVSHADKAKIVNRVGRLALAIKLAGGQLIRQSPEDWHKGFDVHKLKSRRPDPKNPHDNLEVCFDLSLSQLTTENRRLYSALSIFREDEPILEQAVAKLWDAYGDCDPNTTSALIDELGALALLEITVDKSPRTFILHNLLRHLMNDELGTDRKSVHEALIAAYAATKTGNSWATAPDDGYLYTHLTYHLHKLGRNDELYALLTDSPAWMEAKFIACIGDRSYVDDLELAISDFSDGLTADRVLKLTKLWTARQVVNARVNLYTDTDLKTLVWMGRTQEAITHATLRASVRERVDGLFAIMEVQGIDPELHNGLLQQVLEHARDIEDVSYRAEALRDIVAALAKKGRLDEALTIARTLKYAYDRAAALRVVAVALTQSGHGDEALTIARSLEYAYDRATALCVVAVALTQAGQNAVPVFDEALTTARAIDDTNTRADALRDIAVALTQAGQNAVPVFDKALTTARAIKDPSSRTDALYALAIALAHAGYFDEALTIARTIKHFPSRAEAFRDITVALSRAGHFDEALTVAHAIEYFLARAEALRALAVALDRAGHNAASVFDESLIAARAIKDDYRRTTSLRNTAVALTHAGHLDKALNIVRAIKDNYRRAVALRAIAAALAKAGQNAVPVFDEALTAAHAIKDPSSHAAALRAVAAALAKAGQNAVPVFDEALTAARAIKDPSSHAVTLRAVAAALAQEEHLDEALTIVRVIEDASSRDAALRDITDALTQVSHLDEALTIAHTIEYFPSRAAALRDVADALARAGHNAGPVLDETLIAARAIEDASSRVAALRTIADALAQAGHNAGPVFDETLIAARAIEDASSRAVALRDIAAALARAGHLDEALTIARTIEDDYRRAAALRDIAVALARAGHNAGPSFDEALTAARAIENVSSRTAALRTIAAALARAGNLDKGLTIARAIEDASSRAVALRDIATALAKIGNSATPIFDEALTTAHTIEDASSRAFALRDIATALAKVGNLDKALTIAYAIEDVSSRAVALRDIAVSLTNNRLVTRAFNVLGFWDASKYLQVLISCREGFESIQSGLTFAVLRDATQIIAWEKPQWRDIHAILAKATAS